MIAPDDQQVLARRSVPTRRIVVNSAVAHVHAINDGKIQRSTALDHSTAHDLSSFSFWSDDGRGMPREWLSSRFLWRLARPAEPGQRLPLARCECAAD